MREVAYAPTDMSEIGPWLIAIVVVIIALDCAAIVVVLSH